MTTYKKRGQTPFLVLRVPAVLVMVLGSAFALAQAPPPTAAGSKPVVYSAEVESIIHPVSAAFMIETIERADADNAALVLFTLRTPGGLVDSTRDIVTKMISAKTPVAVYVGPSGARAASAGFIITIAADIAAMAPGTHIGAAHPVSGGGAAMDETSSKKAAEDMAAYVRTIAAKRGRNAQLAEQAVLQSKAFTEEEALKAAPPLIDLIASSADDLLEKIDGRTVTRFDGRTIALRTSAAQVVDVEMTLRQRILSSIAHPNIAYILLSLGTLGLTIELWSPGAILPGVVGGLSLLLAFFALQVLPINYVGLLLMIFGLALFALEIKVTSYGLLTVGGIIALIFGSLMLIDSPAPELQLNPALVVSTVVGFTAIAGFLVRLAVAAQRTAPVSGAEGLVGERGEVLTPIAPGAPGSVRVHGEIWNAVASEPVSSGVRVIVTNLNGLTLTVRKE
ncbi:MAG: nodulation protein NfeD [Acidobacteria bacterium]|nr:MAG: nodulation protein NfeD [Acidobacteriota bacterium]